MIVWPVEHHFPHLADPDGFADLLESVAESAASRPELRFSDRLTPQTAAKPIAHTGWPAAHSATAAEPNMTISNARCCDAESFTRARGEPNTAHSTIHAAGAAIASAHATPQPQ